MSRLTHGHRTVNATSSTYKSWLCMKQRCNNKNHVAYKYYGGSGITYDPAWESFECFLSDLGECPKGLTLDRLNNSKNYTKDNCRWATRKEQANNRRLSCKNISGHFGITWDKWNNKWLVMKNKKNLGRFINLQDAINKLQGE